LGLVATRQLIILINKSDRSLRKADTFKAKKSLNLNTNNKTDQIKTPDKNEEKIDDIIFAIP
jgi:hypothetical protein